MDRECLMLLQEEMAACRRCRTEGFHIVPGAIFSGDAGADMMIIGQAPGITEVTAKRPFNAGSGQRLFQWLSGGGITEPSFRQNQYMTSVTKCYPGKNRSGKGDRVPSRREQKLCRAFLEEELKLANPKIIIPVGSLAIRLFFSKALRLSEVIGKVAFWPDAPRDKWPQYDLGAEEMLASLPDTVGANGRWIVPLPHPSGASLWPNQPENKLLIEQAVKILREICSSLEIQSL